MFFELFGLQQFSQRNRTVCFVRYFDPDGSFSGDRRFDTNIGSCQVQLDVIGKIDDPADLHSLIRCKLIAGNGRTAAHIGNAYTDTKVVECLLKLGCRLTELLIPPDRRIAFRLA